MLKRARAAGDDNLKIKVISKLNEALLRALSHPLAEAPLTVARAVPGHQGGAMG